MIARTLKMTDDLSLTDMQTRHKPSGDEETPRCSRRSCRCDRTCCVGFLRRNLLLLLLVASLAVGIAMGIGLRFVGAPLSARELMYFKFPGELLMRMLKALVVPLMVSSLVSGLGGMDTRSSGRMGLYSIVYYMSTTFSAVLLGILLVCTIRPGQNAAREATGSQEPGNIADSFLDLLRSAPGNCSSYVFQSWNRVTF